MPVEFKKNRVYLVGEVVVDDAETLFAWLVSHSSAQVDASEASHLHAAVLQAIAASRRPIAKMPADPFLAACLRQLAMQNTAERT
jgi:hypothetical protein